MAGEGGFGGNRRRLGDEAEDFVAAWLQARGLRVIARNVAFRFGELDLVALDGDVVVFVEVRRRRPGRFGGGLASVDRRKRRRIVLAARAWLAGRRQFAAYGGRFDVVAVADDGRALSPDWQRDAFRADDA